MENFALVDQPTSSVRLSIPNLNSLGVLFGNASLNEMVLSLDRFHTTLKSILGTPSIIHYEELVLLRRRAAQANLSTSTFSRAQSQLRLAIELLRLGRRSEGFRLLAQIEERLPLTVEDTELRDTALTYGVWIALIRATAGDAESGLASAKRLARLSSDPEIGKQLLAFFRRLN